jgi:eukaryotic-like serine/threonine-protein kinase
VTTGEVLVGRYRLLGPLGTGSGGRVHEAEDVTLGRRVAVKILAEPGQGPVDPALRERFRREALALARVSSSVVVRVLDVGVSAGGSPFLVMELLDGLDLQTLVERTGPLPVDVVWAVAAGICGGLAAIHEAGVVHRDIKPSNVMVTRSGRVVLFDFGLARAVDNAPLTQLGTFVGTPGYMAPEMVRGLPPKPVADLYGLGACMYAMVTGRPPFAAHEEIGAVVLRIVDEGLPPLADVWDGSDHALTALVDALVAPDPAARPQTAAEVLDRMPAEPSARTWQTLREKVADCVRDQAVATMTRPPDSSLPDYAFNGVSQTSRPGLARPGTAWETAGPRPLALSGTTRQLVMSGMTAQNAASRQREAVALVLRGELQEAVRMLTAVVRACSSTLGRNHPTTLAGEYWQAVCMARLGAGGEAVALFSSVNERCEQGRSAEGE